MSTVQCCAVDVFVPGDLDYGSTIYPTQGFSFVVNCPPGYFCRPGIFPVTITIDQSRIPPVIIPPDNPPGGTPVTLQSCSGTIMRLIPANATPQQIQVIAGQMQYTWAQEQATCDAINVYGLRPTAKSVVLPNGCLNVSYSVGDIPFSGSGPYTFVFTGATPPGLTATQISGTAFELSGTPTQAGTYVFTATVGSVSVNFQVSIVGITNSPTPATKNSAYSFQFTAAGGTAPYTFTIVAGALPVGLSMTSAGLISGTPTTVQISAFTVSVTDSSP